MKSDWTDWTKWLMVIPGFIGAFLLLGVVARLVLNMLVFDALLRNHYQLAFVIEHLYSDFVVVAFSIYFSCLMAPKRRFTLACLFLAIDLAFVPKRLQIAMSTDLYGAAVWKEPYLIALYLLSGLLPAALLFWEQRHEQADRVSVVAP